MRIDLKPNEFVLKASDSKHLSERMKIPGKLVLTNQSLYFTTINGHEPRLKFEIPTFRIREVSDFSCGILAPKGLQFSMKDGEELRFEVKKRNQWNEIIAKLI